jgi:TatD DNase family protein
MFVDTHCHLNMMVKKDFDVQLSPAQVRNAASFITHAAAAEVTTIINVGTSLVESKNCVMLGQAYEKVFATLGIHPNDCTSQWQQELKQFEALLKEKEKNKIVALGECGIDRHYPDYNLQQQIDVFKAQIELALTYDCALSVHSRDAYDETLRVLEEYARHRPRAVMHCFSYDQNYADQIIGWGFKLGIGGTITYPNNQELRAVVMAVKLHDIVLETDAPFLPPQSIRGQQNNPAQIAVIAAYIAELKGITVDQVAAQTTTNAQALFRC